MRKKEREVADRGEMEEILSRAEVVRIAMCDGDEPYVVPVNFGYEGGCLYFHCAQEGRKLDILRKNNRICFEASTDIHLHLTDSGAKGCTTHYKCVIGFGRAEILEDTEAKLEGLHLLMSHYTDVESDFPEGLVDRTCVVRVKVESMTGKRRPEA